MTESATRAVIEEVFRSERIAEERACALEKPYVAILESVLAWRARSAPRPAILGICGSQGSGKSTMARVLKEVAARIHGLSVAVLSLDDLYLPRAERERLAHEVHPLLRTRGVPGTHDVELGIDTLARLVSAESSERTRIPRFDKALDDRSSAESWEIFPGRADLVILEGWCVGARPQKEADLQPPLNELERQLDPDGRWRRYVNTQLAGRYQDLFGLLHHLVMIRAPGFEVVLRWRTEQEHKLRQRLAAGSAPSGARAMSDEEIAHFISHYERLTRHVLQEMPGRADLLVNLDAQRNIASIAESS